MGAGFDQDDPFKKYGGKQVLDKEDPFKKYGGTLVAEPIKKKVPSLLGGAISNALSGGLGSVENTLPETDVDKERQRREQEYNDIQSTPEFKNDPLKTLNKFIIGQGAATMLNQKPVAESTGQKYLRPDHVINEDKINKYNVKALQNTVQEKMFPTAQSARDRIFSDEKKGVVDTNNETDVLAKKVLDKSKNIADLIKSNDGDLKKAATQYYGQTDSQIRTVLKEGKEIPEETKEIKLGQFLNEPLVKELAFDGHVPGLNQAYLEQKGNYRLNNPLQWTNDIVEKIAQGREDYGFNNPVLNLVGTDGADRVIQKLYEDKKIDKQDLQHYQETVRPLLAVHAKEIPTSGLIENAFQGIGKSLSGLPRTIAEMTGARNLYTTPGERQQEILQDDANEIKFKPKGLINNISHATGNIIGALAPISGEAKGLEALNLIKDAKTAGQVAMATTFYHDLYKDAERNNPEGGLLNQLQATLQATVFAKLNPVLGRLSGTAIKEATPEIQETLQQLQSNSISGAAAQKKLTDVVLGGINKFAKATGQSISASSQMATAGMINDAIGGVFTGKYDLNQSIQKAASTFQSMMYGTLLPNLLVTPGAKANVGKTMYEMTSDPEQSRATIEKSLKDNPSLPPEILQNFDHATEVRKELDAREDLSQPQKEKYLVAEVNQKILQDKIEKSKSKTLSEKDQKKVEELETEKKDILAGKEETLSPEQEVIKKSLDNNEITGMYKGIAQEAVKSPGDAKVFLEDANSQINNKVEGELGNSGEAAKKTFGKTISDHVATTEQPSTIPISESGKPKLLKEDYDLSKDNETDAMSDIGDGLGFVQYGYKREGDTVIRLKNHTPDWSNFVEDIEDNGVKKIVNVTVGDYSNRDRQKDKTTMEEMQKRYPDVEFKNIRVEDGESINDAINKIHSELKSRKSSSIPVQGRYKFPLPNKPITEMNASELDAHAKEIKDFQKKTKLTKEQEDNLSEEDKADYYGKNLDPNGVYDPVEIQRIANRVSGIEEAETAKEISEWIKRPLIDFARKKDTENLAVLKAASRRASELGIDANELISESFKKVAGELKDIDAVKQIFDSITQQNETPTITEGNKENKQSPQSTEETGGNDKPPIENTTGAAEGESEEPKVTSIKNEIVDKEREKRGLAPAMQAAKKEFGTSWDEALKVIEDNPDKGSELVGELKNKPRPLSDVENAILLHRQVELQNAYDKVNNAINEAAAKDDKAGVQENRLRLAGLSDALQDVYNAGKAAGTENARGLATRQMLAKEDFTLASMETKKRAANNGRELTDDEREHIQKLSTRISELETRLAELEKEKEEGKFKSSGKKSKKTSEDYSNERKKIVENIKDKLKKSRGETSATVVPFAKELIAIAPEIGKYVKSLVEQGITKLDEIVTDIHDLLKDDITGISTNDVKDLVTGKYDQPQQKKALSPEQEKIKAEIERNKKNFRTELEKDRLKNRGKLEKGLDTFVKWQRAFKLSRATTLAKLTMAAIYRTAFTPIEDMVGEGVQKLLPKKLVDQAYREAGFNAKAEAKAITSMFTRGMKDAAQTLQLKKGGRSDLDVMYGKEGLLPPEAADFFGHLHSALKAPIKRAEFERSFEKRTAAMIKGGIDVSDPLVQTSIAAEAYKDANRSIFMQDNLVSEGWNRVMQAMEQNKINPPAGKVAAAIGRFLVPFVKVPTNIVGETFTIIGGVPFGLARLGVAAYKGFENISPKEKDIILRTLKKGSLGTAFMLMGYFNPQAVGGYYMGKRKESDVEPGGMRLCGWDVPKWLVHNPYMEAIQVGSTVRRVADSKGGDIGKGIVKSMLALGSEIPFVQEGSEINKLIGTDQDRNDFFGRLAENTLVPGLVQEVAGWTDNGAKRKPTSIKENLEMGIPGLRKNVPFKRSYTSEDKNLPGLKYFTDKGMDLPYTSAKSIPINNPKTGEQKKLSDYPEEKITEYYDTKKKIMAKELEHLEKRQTVYIDNYGHASTTPGKYKERAKLDDLNEKQLADILSIISGEAAEETRTSIFKQK